MPKHYPWLWFDADNTLFDFDKAEGLALAGAFNALAIPFEEGHLGTYHTINQQLWHALERQEITAAALPVRRFELLVEALQCAGSPHQLSAAYMEQLALCGDLIEGAYQILEALQETCRFAIVTNGLKAVQRGRLAHSPIQPFIAELIISEEVGAAKPKPAFFQAAFARTGHPAHTDVLVIGDSLTADIQGASDYGLDTCWYNPNALPRPVGLPITYEIKHLRELLELLN